MIRGTTHARLVGQRDASDMYWDHMTGWGWMMMLLWTIVLVVLAVGMIWAILTTSRGSSVQGTGTSSSTPDAPLSARELLDQRLARGEIDTEEYQQRRSALEEPLTHR